MRQAALLSSGGIVIQDASGRRGGLGWVPRAPSKDRRRAARLALTAGSMLANYCRSYSTTSGGQPELLRRCATLGDARASRLVSHSDRARSFEPTRDRIHSYANDRRLPCGRQLGETARACARTDRKRPARRRHQAPHEQQRLRRHAGGTPSHIFSEKSRHWGQLARDARGSSFARR